MRPCPRSGSEQYVKNGAIHTEKQKYRGTACGRQFVDDPQNIPSPPARALIDKLLLEKIPLVGSVRVIGVSVRWLQYYVNDKYAHGPRPVPVTAKKKAA